MEFLRTNRLKVVYTKDEYLRDIIEIEKEQNDNGFVSLWSMSKHLNSMEKNDSLHLTILDNNDKFVGYMIINFENKNMELMRINLKNRDEGYGFEIIQEIIRYAFTKTDVNRLWLDVRHINERGIYLYKKLGFVKEGELREAVLHKNKFLNVIIMSILRSEYEKNIFRYS